MSHRITIPKSHKVHIESTLGDTLFWWGCSSPSGNDVTWSLDSYFTRAEAIKGHHRNCPGWT